MNNAGIEIREELDRKILSLFRKHICIVDSNIKSYNNSLQSKGIRLLGQLGKYKQYKIFCTSRTVLKKMHYCVAWEQ